jgi:PAS domain S-box-containing protein
MKLPHVPGPKLLLVDDRPANLLALEAVLGDSGYVLLMAHSGEEALAVLEKQPDIALVLLDVQMPVMDGYEVIKRIKQHRELQEIPIIFITAIHTEDPFVKKGYQVGAVDYFSKPFDPDILKMKVEIYASFRQRANLLKERERQIKESEELLRVGRKLSAVLESLPVGVIIADVDARVCQTNDEVLRILKSTEQARNEVYGEFLKWWERHGHILKGPDSLLRRALTEGHASHRETAEINCLDGSSKSVFISASPLRGLDRHIVGAVVVLQDVTVPREIEAEMEKRIVHLVSLGVELEGQAARH